MANDEHPKSDNRSQVTMPYLADTPISSLTEDRLGRAKFAERLGEAILAWRSEDSIVVGLYGQWGLGKTSILNMVVDYINDRTKDLPADAQPMILRFNPWNFSEQNQLISMFFHELSLLFGHRDKSAIAKVVGRKLETYGTFFEPLAFIPPIGPWATLVANIMKTLGKSSSRWGELKEQDLSGLRQEINDLLRKRKNRTIIVIDDIDRLNPVEIKQIFQLLKSNADFPNTIYVTAFDPAVVADALEKSYGIPGKEYLEKIIQISFDVPPIEPLRLARVFSEELDKTLSHVPEENWDQRRWGNLYHSSLKMLLNSLRDVKRFINGLRFNLALVSGEVDPVDLVGIEAIRVFSPKVHRLIAQNKDLFTNPERVEARESLRDRYEKIFLEAPRHLQEPIREICKQLFPQLEYVYRNVSYGSHWQAQWRRELRVCATDVFDKYFLLEVPEGEISEAELKEILRIAGDATKLAESLKELNAGGRIRRFLERLEDYTQLIPVEHVEPIIQALFNIGDELPLEPRGFADVRGDLQAARIIYRLLKRLDTEQERGKILGHTISVTTSVYFPTFIVSLEQPDKSGRVESLLSEGSFDQLKDACINRIHEASRSQALQKAPNLDYILYRWQEWGNRLEVEQYVLELIDTPEGLADFLAGFLQQRLSGGLGDYVAKREWVIPVKHIKHFISLDAIKAKVSRIAQEEMKRFSERQSLAVQIFRAGLSSGESDESD